MTLLELYYGLSGLGFSIGIILIGVKYYRLDKQPNRKGVKQ